MPTRRTPKNRSLRRRITPDLAMKFKRYCELAPIKWDCVAMRACRRTEPGVACDACNEQRELTLELVKHFKLPAVLLPDEFDPPPRGVNELDWWQGCLEEAVAAVKS
jgi:hypothetical protein